jgi:nitrilase
MAPQTPVNRFAPLRIAAVQAAPVLFDTEATITKLEALVREAASDGAQVIAFGESFISGFPIWANVLAPVDQHDFQMQLVESAIEVPGPEVRRLASIARENQVALSIGINEVSPVSVGTVWNANLIFGPDGTLLNHRRKLVATWAERLVWSHGDGHALEPVEVAGTKLGMLLCGENTNPLARYALIGQGEEVHIAAYPPAWPFDRSDSRDEYDLAESIRLRSAAHSFEGKVFNVVAATALDDHAVDLVARGDESIVKMLRAKPTASMILGPSGQYLAGPLIADEGILYADVNPRDRIVPKQAHDITGTYQRMDVFSFGVNKSRHVPVTTTNDDRSPRAISTEETFHE